LPRFFLSDDAEEAVSYEIFMGIVHEYADKVMRA
jgi:hypothetical protein